MSEYRYRRVDTGKVVTSSKRRPRLEKSRRWERVSAPDGAPEPMAKVGRAPRKRDRRTSAKGVVDVSGMQAAQREREAAEKTPKTGGYSGRD